MLLQELINLGCFQEGDFTLKSGKKSKYYIDLRCLVSHPTILRKIVQLIRPHLQGIDKICGLPYAGIPYASAISTLYNKSMILLRKERKQYGTKKMIEGDYVEGEELIIIDDILTSGKSILESLEHLKDFKIKKIVVIIDREEGGREVLEDMGFRVESIFTIQDIISTTNTRENMVQNIRNVIKEKSSNICISLDYTRTYNILNTIEILKNNIVMVKLHCDIIEDFTPQFVKQLVELCEKNKIFIFEDRKFSDIGSTFKKQFMGGIYKIQSWCNITNFHSLVGEGIIKEFSKCKRENQGGLLIAQMSNEGNLLDKNYKEKTIQYAKNNRDSIIGFICQEKISDDDFLYMIPGVNLVNKRDNSDQRYITPKQAIEKGADIIIVGRGIIDSEDILEECKKYQIE